MEQPAQYKPQVTDTDIATLLLRFGIRPSLHGYHYMQHAISMLLEDRKPMRIYKEVYPAVAKKLGYNAKQVERCIRHAVQDTWEKGGPLWQKYFPQKPTNSDFLSMAVEILRQGWE